MTYEFREREETDANLLFTRLPQILCSNSTLETFHTLLFLRTFPRYNHSAASAHRILRQVRSSSCGNGPI